MCPLGRYRYNEYVTEWFTINEPQYCNWQFSTYPGADYYPISHNVSPGIESRLLCGHHALLAHAKVYRWYKDEFGGTEKMSLQELGQLRRGQLVLARRRRRRRRLAPYPDSLHDTLGELLPEFTPEESELVSGSCDFSAIDPYPSYYASAIDDADACTSTSSHRSYPECAGSQPLAPGWSAIGPVADSGVNWLWSVPQGVRRFLGKITKELFHSFTEFVVTEFVVTEFGVTEFGVAEPGASNLDSLSAIHFAARVYDGVNVIAAWVWAIYDNYEWFSGSSVRFELQWDPEIVDVPCPARAFHRIWIKFFGHSWEWASAAGVALQDFALNCPPREFA
ncbi:glycoside hydrolase superfamily [Diaporthe sp. PMI_573]|nr:glycoside hydrolase superfamily [Diaporthaceae sp. PMI_573]